MYIAVTDSNHWFNIVPHCKTTLALSLNISEVTSLICGVRSNVVQL